MFKVGLRVVPRKVTKWKIYKSGKECVGTVIGLQDDKSKTVTVCWDNGTVSDCRVGLKDTYDLRVFDNAPVGVRHPGITCMECQESIIGFRFKCLHCPDFDLCMYCYMNESAHDMSHHFCRFDSDEESMVIKLPLRIRSKKRIAKGIFKDARVVRGQDWHYGDDYGNTTCEGTVLQICSSNHFDRGVAEVSFSSGQKGFFAVGLKGRVDIKFVKSSSNGNYYPDHLPYLVHPSIDSSSGPLRKMEMLSIQSLQQMVQQTLQDELKDDHLKFATAMYKDHMEESLTTPRFIAEEDLRDYHENAFQTVLKCVGLMKPLSDTLIEKVQQVLEPLYDDFKEVNARKLTSKAPAIGIDIGTTYCCVAYYNNECVNVIQNFSSEDSTPSYVQFDEDDVVVGITAKNMAYRKPQDTIFDFKRMFGRCFDDSSIQGLLPYWPFKLIKDEDGFIQIKIQNQYLRPEQVLTKLLLYLKETADEFLGEPVINAVVTVPAYFNTKQRALTKDACKKAGLDVLQLISEPAAAAVAYHLNLDHESERRRCLIFDLGGGTFDVAIAEFHNKKMKIKAIDGDPYLGGEDFDNAMIQYCVDVFKREHNVDLLTVGNEAERSRRKERIKKECENQKCSLTFKPIVNVCIDAIYKDKLLKVEFSRDTFSELIKPHVDKCMKIVDYVLAKCHMKETDINDIMIVGGSSRIPYVQSRLSEKFGRRTLLKTIAPELAVAHGAALVAYHSENPELPNVAIQDLIMRPGPE